MKKIVFPLAFLVFLGAACSQQQVTNSPGASKQPVNTSPTAVNEASTNTNGSTTSVIWENTGGGWVALGTPPDCPDPFVMQPPVNLAQVTSVLYPGQSRPDYKPHGGFRFDNAADNAMVVTVPLEGKIIRGSRYLVAGETQYTFDIVHPCGMMMRFGHLLELTPKFQAIINTFPPSQEGDSRTTRVEPPLPVALGEVIATKVGLTKPEKNVFFDFGLFDLRAKNVVSQSPSYAASHSPELDQHAVCWLDYLNPADKVAVRGLPPGDPKAGKTSDYCK
ncbi:MAG: hypothetical protein HY340_01430 [Candidatus Kerfeldbacteria bacterium]|nr:hypothetical protein [Candidatus Kerfeldbacteria bacterium]